MTSEDLGNEEPRGREEDAAADAADLLFESFFDRDSGAWSLRRIASEPPSEALVVDETGEIDEATPPPDPDHP